MQDYVSMARLARTLLEQGKSNEEVLRACYGVPFPGEAFVLARMNAENAEPPVSFTSRPWDLIIALDRGGPPPQPNFLDEDQATVTAIDSGLIALMFLQGDSLHGGSLLCYRRDELAAGRSTVFALARHELEAGRSTLTLTRELREGWGPERVGDSLVAVLREHFADGVERIEAEIRSPSNQGAGSADQGDVDAAHAWLQQVEDLATVVANPGLSPWKVRSVAKQLFDTAGAGDLAALRALISQGAPVDPPQGEDSALLNAIMKNQHAAARFLLEAGADLEHTGRYSRLGPLERACRFSDLPMVELVLEAGASLDARDVVDAAAHRRERPLARQLLSLLVKRGIGPNARGTGSTILMAVCREGDLEAARLLLDRGADPNTRILGTALTVAEEHGHQVVVDLLLERGAKPERPERAPDGAGDAAWLAAQEQPREAHRRLAWAEALLRRGMRAAAAREVQAATTLGAQAPTALLDGLSLENPPGTRWHFAPFGTASDVAPPIEDTRFPGAWLTSGTKTLPLAALLGPPCARCDDSGEVPCSDCEGSVACGLPALNDWFACGVCGFFVCRCPRS